MSVYPHWRSNKEPRVIIKNLSLLEQVALEDGVFYKDGFSVVDAKGASVQVRLASQDADETQLAGTGIYGQFIIESLPLNPCKITYIPRFTDEDENPEYVKESFENVSSVEEPLLKRNIDVEVEASVMPDQDAILSFGNFTNTNRMVKALDKLSATLSQYYFDIDALPLAIEATYLNSKQGSRDAIEAMRGLELAEINGTELTTDSLRILTSPPKGEMYGNYIYISYRDETFTYRDETVSIVRGDICVINSGVLTTLLYGTDLKYKIGTIQNSLASITSYADNIQPTLPTVSKDITDAVEEYVDSINGYYSDSLYVIADIDGSEDLQIYNGTTIGLVSTPFVYDGEIFNKDDIILIISGEYIHIGVTEDEVDRLNEIKVTLSNYKATLIDKLSPLLLLDSLFDLDAGTTVPSLADKDVVINGTQITISGTNLNDKGADNIILESIDEIDGDGYINSDEVVELTSTIDNDGSKLGQMSNDISALNAILDNMPDGMYTLLPMDIRSESGYYYKGLPIVLDGYSLYIKDLVYIDLGGLEIVRIKIIDDIIYLITTDGLYVVDLDKSSVSPMTNYTVFHNANNIITLSGRLSAVTYVNDSSVIESADGTIVTEGRVLEAIPNTNILVVDLNDGIYLVNTLNDSRVAIPTEGDMAYLSGNNVLIAKGGCIKSMLDKDGLINYTYDADTFADDGKFNIFDGQDNPTIKITGYEVEFKVVVV